MNKSASIELALKENFNNTAVEDTRKLLANASNGDETAMAKLVELLKENIQSSAMQKAYNTHYKSFYEVIKAFITAVKSERVLLGLQLLMLTAYFDDVPPPDAQDTASLLEIVESHLNHEYSAIRKVAWRYILHTIMTTGASMHLLQSASQPRHLMEILTDPDVNIPMKVVTVQVLGFAFQTSDSKQSFLSESLGWMTFTIHTISDYKNNSMLCIMVLQFLNNMAKEPELFFYFNAEDCLLLQPLLTILKHADEITYEPQQTEVLGILMNMALAPENKSRFALSELGLLPLVTEFARNKAGELQINALNILWNMAQDTNNQALFASSELSLLPLLVSLVKDRTGEVKAKALGILFNMAYNDTNHALFTSSELELMPLIVSVVKEENGPARLNALGILWNMASNAEINFKVFAKPSLGLIPALQQVLMDGEDVIRINALGVLWNMASNNRNKVLLVKEEFALLPQLSNLIRNYTDDQRMNALGALWSMSNITANHKLFCGSVVLPAVMHVMKHETHDHEVLFKALGILNNLAIDHSCQKYLMASEYDLRTIVTNYCFEETAPPKTRVKASTLLAKIVANVSFRLVFANSNLNLVSRLTNLFADLETADLGLASSAMLLLAKLAAAEAIADLLFSENNTPFIRLINVLKDGHDAIRYYCLQVLMELSLVRPAAIQAHPMNIVNELLVQVDKFENMTVDNSRNVPTASMILLNLSKENQYKLIMNNTSFDMLQRCRHALTKTVAEYLSLDSSDRVGMKIYLLGILFSWTEGIKRHMPVVLTLTDPDLGLLPLLKSALDNDELKSIASSFLWNLAEDGNSDVAQRFVDQDIHTIAVQIIMSDRPADASLTTSMITDGSTADNDDDDESDSKIYVSLLNMLMNLSRHWAVRETLKAAGLADLAISIYNSAGDNRDSVKAMIILLFLFGNEERESAERAGRHFVIGDRQIAQLLSILSLTLQSQGGADFPLGTFCLGVLIHVCVVLAQSDSNKGILVQEGAIPLIIDALSRFQLNQAEIYLCGGGGDDEQVADLCIEALTQIAFDFETDKSLQGAFLSNSLDVTELIRGVSSNHKLNADARTKAGLLYERLVSTDDKKSIRSIESSDSVSASSLLDTPHTPTDNICDDDNRAREAVQHRPRHIMLSYCWHSSANTSHVKSLANELRQLGHDVWRDEEGSTIVPPMSGSVDDRMAEAIENSETVVICVSAAYKLSSNCRLEAQYANALAKRRKLKLIFVMLNEHYTTVSSPNYCDGWLGIMVGSHLWQPMWREEMIAAVARAIAGQVHDCTRIDTVPSLHNESHESGNQTVISRSVLLQRENNLLFTDDNRLTVWSHEIATKPVLTASESAWNVLVSTNKVANYQLLQSYLDELGVDSAEDLAFCLENMLQQMAQFLKPVAKNKFLYFAEKIEKKQAQSSGIEYESQSVQK